MPRYTRRRLPKRPLRGGSIMSWLKKAGGWLKNTALPFVKKHKLASRGLNLIPHEYAKTAAKVAGTLGYGRRRRGGALRMAGGSLYM